jgi:hypothetical protein
MALDGLTILLVSLDVSFGAGACTLVSWRVIWCGEYRTAVEVSACNPQNMQGVEQSQGQDVVYPSARRPGVADWRVEHSC